MHDPQQVPWNHNRGRSESQSLRLIEYNDNGYLVDLAKREFRRVDRPREVVYFDSQLGRRMAEVPVLTHCPHCKMVTFVPVRLAGRMHRCIRCGGLAAVDLSRRWPE